MFIIRPEPPYKPSEVNTANINKAIKKWKLKLPIKYELL